MKNAILKNWKTTASGAALLLLAALELAGVKIPGVAESPGALIAQGIAGLGLIVAKDSSS